MARLNWQKLALDQRNARSAAQAKQTQDSKIWFIGQYYGYNIADLPVDYLIWVSENFAESNYHRQRADVELIRRYNQIESGSNSKTIKKILKPKKHKKKNARRARQVHKISTTTQANTGSPAATPPWE